MNGVTAVESAADRQVFLADFGVDITYEPASGLPASITAIVSAAFAELAEQAGTGIVARGMAAKISSEDLPAGAARGDSVIAPQGSFTVTEIHPDGTGFSLVFLERTL